MTAESGAGQELREHLFHDPLRPHPEDAPANFRPEVESQILYLVTVPANVQVREARVKSIGPWDLGSWATRTGGSSAVPGCSRLSWAGLTPGSTISAD